MKYIVIILFVLAYCTIVAQLPKGYPSCYNEWRKYKYVAIDSTTSVKRDSTIFFIDLKGSDSLDIISKFFKRSNMSIRSMQLPLRINYLVY